MMDREEHLKGSEIDLLAREIPGEIKKVHVANPYDIACILFTACCTDTVCVMQSTGAALNYCMMICLRFAP